MALDRGTLAKIDRRVFSELDHAGGVQVVKVPVSDAVWSTWRRYCEAMGLSMGEGVAGLISHELQTVVGTRGDSGALFVEDFERKAKDRTSRLDARAQELDTRTEQLKRREEQLRVWEQRTGTRRMSGDRVPGSEKIGRNERCPCGSGLKYKHCHGLPGRLR